MISWILIAVIAYILLALNGVADKFLLTKVERHPVVYAFYSSILSPLIFLLAPFGLEMLSFGNFLVAVVSGIAFTLAIYFLYASIQQTSISRILPIQGGLVPGFTLILAYMLLNERLQDYQYIAFLFLLTGSVLISLKHDDSGWHPKALKSAIVAAFLFALSFVLTKYIFDQSNFVSGMVWTRIGFFLTALAFLIPKEFRRQIFHAPKHAKAKNIALYYGVRINGGIAGLLQNYAISLGSVSIVNAMQGVQFVFLLALTTFLSVYYPKVLKEKITRLTIVQKIFAIVLITIGLLMLNS